MGIFTIVLQCLLIAAFLGSGLSKLAGARMQVDTFRHLKLPQWFRIVTGLVQVTGAIGLIVGFWNERVMVLAAFWIACTMLGALLSHLRVGDPPKQYVAPGVLLVLALLLGLV